MVDGVHFLIKNPALKENRRLLYRMAEISVISQKFLFSHIQNFIPNIFYIHHFLIYDPIMEIFYGALHEPRVQCIVTFRFRFIYLPGR